MNLKDKQKAVIAALTDPPAVCKGLVHLLQCQTADEQAASGANTRNRTGFSVASVKQGTVLAQKVLAGDELSEAELEKGREICAYHSKQLARADLFPAAQPTVTATA